MRRVILLLLASAIALAQSAPKAGYKPPRLPWGDPDLQGIWPGTDLINVPLQRPENFGTRLYLTDEEYAQRAAQLDQRSKAGQAPARPDQPVSINPPGYWLDFGKATRLTSLIVDPADGRMPAYTAAALEKRAARNAARQGRGPNESFTDQSIYDRCISRGVLGSILPVIYNNGNQIHQAPGYVVIRYEMIHEARIIPLDGRPFVGGGFRSYMGDGRGHWEGDTLVVETRNFLGDRNGLGGNGGGDPHSADMVLVERWTRVAPDEMYYEATVNDPKTWVAPFKIAMPLRADPQYELFEYACHEGNYAMFNMLQGARADEAAAAAARN
jgi:hypothetical protein